MKITADQTVELIKALADKGSYIVSCESHLDPYERTYWFYTNDLRHSDDCYKTWDDAFSGLMAYARRNLLLDLSFRMEAVEL